MSETEITKKLLDAALNHVVFDGWTQVTFDAAVAESGVDPSLARALYPRDAADLAVAYHRRGDAALAARLAAEDLSELRFRDRVAAAVRWRIEDEDREIVRKGTTLFALPHLAGTGAKLIWETADTIWSGLGDTSRDFNWYTKRATLSAVFSSTVLFWLGDDSEKAQDSWDFLDRRIDNVMQFEQAKAKMSGSGLGKAILSGLAGIKAPSGNDGLPGRRG